MINPRVRRLIHKPDRIAADMLNIPTQKGMLGARLRECADLLQAQGKNGYRVKAYSTAAREIEALSDLLWDRFKTSGAKALVALRGIVRGIAARLS